MAGSDPKTSRAFGQTSARNDIDAEEDPLVELARIVSEDGAFSGPKPEKPKAVRPEPFERNDLADGLEAELLQELETSFGGREPPAPVRPHAPARENPPPPAPRVSAAPAPERQSEDLDPDELLRSIEEQLGQFERRHAARFAGAPAVEAEVSDRELSPPAEPPREPIFGAPRTEAQSRRASRIRPFAETFEAAPAQEPIAEEPSDTAPAARSDYRFRGPASADWDLTPGDDEAVEPSREEIQQEWPGRPERKPEVDLFAVGAADALGQAEEAPDQLGDEDSREAQRRERRASLFPEFDEEPVAARAEPDHAGSIEMGLSRELEPSYAQVPDDKWQDGDAPADEPTAAATIAPGPSRRAAAARAAEQRSRSRTGLFTVAGIILVVVIGAGGALFLRSSEQGPSGPPPVIAAEDEPVRLEPAQQQAATEGETVGEAVYNRVAGATSDTEEQVVESAEEPREIARIVLPPSQTAAEDTVVGPVGEESNVPDAAAVPAPATPGAAGEIGPRRVPTYVVRSDGSIVETSAAGSVASDTASAQNQQLASETVPIEPTPVETVQIPDAGSAAADSTESAVLPPPVPRVDTAPPADAVDMTPRPTIDEPPAEVAAVAPAEEPAAPAPESPTDLLASTSETAAPAPDSSGSGYLVQLSAQRSMEQAQSAYADAQQRFASVLGSLSPQIEEANLGEKGIYFRVRVGPWASREDAIEVCESLKAAGGSCFVTQ